MLVLRSRDLGESKAWCGMWDCIRGHSSFAYSSFARSSLAGPFWYDLMVSIERRTSASQGDVQDHANVIIS